MEAGKSFKILRTRPRRNEEMGFEDWLERRLRLKEKRLKRGYELQANELSFYGYPFRLRVRFEVASRDTPS
jgi:hypothetical protein